MALTTEEEEVLKDLAKAQLNKIEIDEINKIALSEIKIKQDEIKAIDDKRNADIDKIK